MNRGFQIIKGVFNNDQRGITGLETAIVLIAFVVVASVFAFAVITTGIFSSEQAQSSAQAGVEAAKSTMSPKGSMILAEAYSTGSPTAGTTTTMTDAGALFVAEGVVVGDLIKNVTDGTSQTITVVTDTIITSNAFAGAWITTDEYRIEMDSVSTIKFKVTPSPGAKPFSLASTSTVVAFNDENTAQNATYLATIPFGGGADVFAAVDTIYWTHQWLVGSGPAIDVGDVVEFTVQVKNMDTPLTTNSNFSVEIVPQTGAALAVARTTPLEMAGVMDLN